jgi:hypothetical protein
MSLDPRGRTRPGRANRASELAPASASSASQCQMPLPLPGFGTWHSATRRGGSDPRMAAYYVRQAQMKTQALAAFALADRYNSPLELHRDRDESANKHSPTSPNVGEREGEKFIISIA